MADEDRSKVSTTRLEYDELEEGQIRERSPTWRMPPHDSYVPPAYYGPRPQPDSSRPRVSIDRYRSDPRPWESSQHRWCRLPCNPEDNAGNEIYYMHMDTHESTWDEPAEPIWHWLGDWHDGRIDPNGPVHTQSSQNITQQAQAAEHYQRLEKDNYAFKGAASRSAESGARASPKEEYTGYNPKIHGDYDPNAPYAKYHEKKREEERAAEEGARLPNLQSYGDQYAAVGNFNRFTGNFQSGDTNAERHNDFNKSGRQMNAYFDVAAAANSHEGRSLIDERRKQKFTKKEVQEMKERHKAKRVKKKLDFYKS